MCEVEELWNAINRTDKYEENQTFEQYYFNLISDKTCSVDILWEAISQSKDLKYNFDIHFEDNIHIALKVGDGLEDNWNHVSSSNGCGIYETDAMFEEEFVNVEFLRGFNFFSNYKTELRYRTDTAFEESYKEIVSEEPTKSCDKNRQSKVNTSKSKESQNLKNLLDLRLKRLKTMSEHVDTITNDSCRTLVY